jgi:hypothetical protein
MPDPFTGFPFAWLINEVFLALGDGDAVLFLSTFG